MANRLLLSRLNSIQKIQTASIYGRAKIGNRDWVGFGYNGQANYMDRTDFPMPAVRFKENSSDVLALREKEKGDWKKLSLEEKKALYRASFCLTFAEIEAPTGEWKSITGCTLMMISLAIWLLIAEKKYIMPPLPPTFTKEYKQGELQKWIDCEYNPVTGLASHWDYEKNTWKQK